MKLPDNAKKSRRARVIETMGGIFLLFFGEGGGGGGGIL